MIDLENEDYLYEIFYWIEKIVSLNFSDFNDINYGYHVYERLLLLIFTTLINLKKMEKRTIEIIEKLFNNLSLPPYIMNLFKYGDTQIWQNFLNISSYKSSIKEISNHIFNFKNKTLIFDLFNDESDCVNFFEISFEKNNEIYDENYNLCNISYLNDNWNLAKRILAKKTIQKFFKKKKKEIKARITTKNLITPQEIKSFSSIFLRMIDRNFVWDCLFSFYINHDIIAKNFSMINNIKNRIFSIYYQNLKKNSLDFHFLISKADEISFIQKKFEKIILENIFDFKKENNNVNNELFKINEEIFCIDEQVKNWESSFDEIIENEEIFRKTKKKLAMNLIKQGLISRAKEILDKKTIFKNKLKNQKNLIIFEENK